MMLLCLSRRGIRMKEEGWLLCGARFDSAMEGLEGGAKID